MVRCERSANELMSLNRRVAMRNIPRCIGVVNQNPTKICPWRTGIPQSLCVLRTETSDGRVKNRRLEIALSHQRWFKEESQFWNPQWLAMRHVFTVLLLKIHARTQNFTRWFSCIFKCKTFWDMLYVVRML
jgi:hypothetical protein